MCTQWSKRDWLLFCTGAQTFHTLSHLLLGISGSLPIRVFSITFTQEYNMVTIILNGAITALLFWLVLQKKQ